MRLIISTLIMLLASSALAAPPKVLVNGMDAYKKNGREAFIPELIKNSGLEGEKSVLSQANMIGQIEAYYGQFEGWESIAECPLSERFRTTYYLMYYERGLLFGYVDTYMLKDKSEITMKFQFHTEADQILPYKPILQENICDA